MEGVPLLSPVTHQSELSNIGYKCTSTSVQVCTSVQEEIYKMSLTNLSFPPQSPLLVTHLKIFLAHKNLLFLLRFSLTLCQSSEESHLDVLVRDYTETALYVIVAILI